MASIFDLHVHTNRGSPDSALTPEEMVEESKRVGLTGVMITEHVGWPRHDFFSPARPGRARVMISFSAARPAAGLQHCI